MMEEPFWLGLLAVLFVLGILGAAYTVKKHLPEKFDGLLADGTEATKTRTGVGGKQTQPPTNTGNLVSIFLLVFFCLFTQHNKIGLNRKSGSYLKSIYILMGSN